MKDYIIISDEKIPIIIKSRAGLRNITLRPKMIPIRAIYITKPLMVTSAAATRFAMQKSDWLEKFFATPKNIIKDLDILELFGRRVKISHNPHVHSNSYISGDDIDVLIIGGSPEMLERRIRDFIKQEFLIRIKQIIKTMPPEFAPKKISIRDTTTRWGSCSSSGTMSFSWRLAFAPQNVMRYVVIHELAHKKHMDHSADFWATASQLYGDEMGRAKLWLSKNGARLCKYL